MLLAYERGAELMRQHRPDTIIALGAARGFRVVALRSLEDTLALHSGRTTEQVNLDIERDKILTAQAALDYGLIDSLLESRKAVAIVAGR